MNYGQLITGAFRLTWRYKFLWIYGLFLGTSINFSSFNYNFNLEDSETRRFRNLGPVKEITHWVNTNLPLIIALVAIIIFLALLFWLIRIISQSAVIWSVAEAENESDPTFTTAFKVGLKFFWRVLGLFLLVTLFFLLFLLIFLIPPFLIFFASFKSGPLIALPIFGLLILLLIIILIPLVIIVHIMMMFSIRFIVLGGDRILKSIGSSFKLLRDNPGTSILVWLLSAALGIAITIALFAVLILLGIPIGVLAYFLISSGITVAKIAILAGLGILLFIVILAFSGFGQAYFSAFWTLAWIELLRKEKIVEE